LPNFLKYWLGGRCVVGDCSKFLAIQDALRLEETGFFSESVGDIDIMWKKPGFWLLVRGKKPGFLLSLLVISI
jgi:hypothetical protein